MTAHRCPVCGGNGQVMGGFYDQVGGAWTTSGISFETCRSCGGTGVVWEHDIVPVSSPWYPEPSVGDPFPGTIPADWPSEGTK